VSTYCYGVNWYLSVLLLFSFRPLVTNFSYCHLSRVLVFLFLLLWSAMSSKPFLSFFSFVVSFSQPIICSFSISYIVIMTNDPYSENYKRSLDQHQINKSSIICLNFSCLHFNLYLSYSGIIWSLGLTLNHCIAKLCSFISIFSYFIYNFRLLVKQTWCSLHITLPCVWLYTLFYLFAILQSLTCNNGKIRTIQTDINSLFLYN
jgi:hypothetical protein